MKSEVCLNCLKDKEWYAFFNHGNMMIIRQLDRNNLDEEHCKTCVFSIKKIDRENMDCYTDNIDNLRTMFKKVKAIPKQCEHYCEHVIIGNTR